MNIAVNTQLLIKDRLEGIGWFTYETLRRITKDHPEHRFFLIFDRHWDPSFVFSDNVVPIKTYLPSRHPLLWYLRFHCEIPKLLKKHQIDLFVSPDGWNTSTDIPSLVVMHDLNFMHFPENMPLLTRLYYRHFFPIYAKKACRLATVSHFSQKDIANTFGISPDNIDVVYNGASDIFAPLGAGQISEIRNRYASGNPYFVFVGALNPRKNLQRLIEAFDAFSTHSSSDIRLVISGMPMFSNGTLGRVLGKARHRDRIVLTGRLQREELARLVGAAHALVLPSTYEGFGIPIVEAMKCHVPVITSNCTAMPEIAGDAALLVDPWSVLSISEAMEKLDNNESLRNDLIRRGQERAKLFSWDNTAEGLWHSIDLCLKTKASAQTPALQTQRVKHHNNIR